MHPAYSVIFFTSASGGGYLLLALLGVFGAFGILPADPVLGVVGFGFGFVMVTAGLLSSTFHLGQPLRAWRAFSQWRSSWLSREGVASLVCFAPALILFALTWRYGDAIARQVLGADATLALRAIGAALAACAALTVFCTARIYTSLKTIAAWHNAFVLPGYLLFALLGGAAWLWLLLLAGG